MLMGVGLAAAIVATGLVFRLWPLTDDKVQTHQIVLTSTVLVALAAVMAHPWVAVGFAWLAIHPLWLWLGLRYQVMRFPRGDEMVQVFPTMEALLGQQIQVVLAAGFLVALRAHGIPPVAWHILAWTAIAWGTLNAVVAWRWRTPPLHLPPDATGHGLIGNRPSVAWSIALGLVAAVWLGPVAVLAWLPSGLLWGRLRNWSAVVAALPTVAWLLEGPAGLAVCAVLFVPLAVYLYRQRNVFESRKALWRAAWQDIRHARGWGIGLGSVLLFREAVTEAGVKYHQRCGPHNDWLQSVVEVGPVPALCGLGLLAGVVTAPPTLAGALVLFTAIYALVYFPLHRPDSALVLLVGLAGV